MLITDDGQPSFAAATMETPAVVVSEAALRANIDRVQAIADGAGCELRPHVKTHKSLAIARMQLEAGAAGITVAKTEEALVFMRGGVSSVTVASPVLHPAKIDRLLAAAAEYGTDLRFIADSALGVRLLSERALAGAATAGIYLKVDVGLGRVGVLPGDAHAAGIADMMARLPGLRFLGILSHAGHAYGADGPDGVAAVAAQERLDMLALAHRLRGAGVDVPTISVGSTPTVLASASFDGLHELRPGNYVFFDMNAVRQGICALSDLSLGVVATVLSTGAHTIVDAGSKTLSSDLGAHGMSGGHGYGRAFPFGRSLGEGFPVLRLSEEHGFLPPGIGLRPGDPVLILPNHSCPVANLVGRMTLLRMDGAAEELRAEAAACVR